jgi:imidazolonepropionase-like amidohydrolase/Tol biopolymer transport system component
MISKRFAAHRMAALGLIALAGFGAVAVRSALADPAPKQQAAKADDAGKEGAAKTDDKPKWDVANPPGPWKSVPIDVTQGTWMALDVSPDGKEIAFDLLGDIYTLPITGGEAKPLLAGIPWEIQPKYSPNGKWIAFVSDRGGGDNIWVVDRTGANPKQVTKEDFRNMSLPDWTPDSEFIVARKHFTSSRSLGAGEMWLYHRSGGEGVQLTEKRTPQKSTGEPAFSPDGKYLYMSDDRTPGNTWDYNRDPNGEIYIIQRLDRETGKMAPYITGPGGSVTPTPSPDGKTLAFIRRVRAKSVLFLMDIASGRETPIYDGLDHDLQETWNVQGIYPAMSFTPDSKSILFWAGGHIRKIDVATRAVAEIPFHVKTTLKIRESLHPKFDVAPANFETKMVRFARVSPDGKRVVFETLGKLWLRDLPNGAPKRLTKDEGAFELYPSWSRDGKSIVYTTWNDETFGTVRVIASTGGASRAISVKPGTYVEPVFSPDGANVVFSRIGADNLRSSLWTQDTGLYVVPAKGGAARLVSDHGHEPQFGAASDRVFFNDRDGDEAALKSVAVTGADERTHLKSKWAQRFSLSPDQKWIAWEERFQVYTAPFIGTGRGIELGAKGGALPQVRMSKDAGEWMHWSQDSTKLYWTLGPQLYTRPLNASFTFVDGAPEKLPDAPADGIKLGFSQPYYTPVGRIAFTNARIVSMKGAEVIENGTIVVNGNRIEMIGPTAATAIPSGVRTIDATGKTVIPGLIDVHWHGAMGSDEIVPQQSATNYASLAFGVTTIHNPSSDNSEIFAASEMAKAGVIVAPRIYSSGSILYGATSGQTAPIDNLDDALGHLRRQREIGAVSVKSYMLPRREQRQQVIEAAAQTGMMVVPEGGSVFHQDMNMIVDGHTTIEHSIPQAVLYDDVHQLWTQSGVSHTPTLIVAYGGYFGEQYMYQRYNVWEDKRLLEYTPRRDLDARSRRRDMIPADEDNVVSIARNEKALADLGVNVELGAHGQRDGMGDHWDMWLYAEGGASPLQALAFATINGAKALGMDKDIGSLEPGKLADLVVLDRNPLTDIHNSTSVNMVMVNGRLFDTDMNEIGGKAVKKKPFFFTKEGGDVWSAGRAAASVHAED